MPVTRRKLFALRATVGYAVFAAAWILLSDQVLETFSDPHTLSRFSTFKGLLFIAVTAAMLWVTLQNVPSTADVHLSGTEPPWNPARLLWGLLTPVLATAIEWAFWGNIRPYAFLLYYPAVFGAAWLGGWMAGMLATALAAMLAWFVFVPPAMTLMIDKPAPMLAIGVFFGMGVLISMTLEWLRRAEHRASNTKFQALVEQSLAGIYIIQGERLHYVNPAFAKLFGYTDEDAERLIDTNPIETLVAPEHRELVRQRLQASYATPGEEVRYLATGLRRDGSTIDLEVHGRGLPTADGQTVIGMVLDVSERRRHEAAMQERQALLDRMSKLAKVGGWKLDVRTMQGTRTDGAARILDLDPSQPQSLQITDGLRYFQGQHHDQIEQTLKRAIEHGESYSLELELVTDKGVHKWVRSQGEPVREGGEVVRIEGAIQDISEVHQARAALQAHQERLEQTVRERTAELEASRQEAVRLAHIKSEFLANMSHEIRTPLNGVLGLAQIGLRDHTGPAKQVFEQINASGRLLLGILNDILDFSKIEAGKLHIDLQPVHIGELLARAASMVEERARETGLRLTIQVDPALPVYCLGDALRLEQILLNLLSNAVKFTDKGEVRLSASLGHEGPEHREHLVLTVLDTGIGMSTGQIDTLFRPFEQADNSTTRRYGGTGLGLSISKRLAELLGGAIHAHSAQGEGSRFEVVLPLLRSQAPTAPAPTPPLATAATLDAEVAALIPASPASHAPAGQEQPRLAGLRVLAAEDNHVNQLVLSELLAYEGASVTMCDSGVAIMDRLARDGPQSYDIVLMDIQMPQMDGYEATRLIRSMAPGLPVIGQTAHAMSEEHGKCRAAGMVDLVVKPIELEALVAAIRRHAPASV